MSGWRSKIAPGRLCSKAISLRSDCIALRSRGCRYAALCTRPHSEAEFMGALYVVEGSTLGGVQIARALAPLVARKGGGGRSFFLGYGDRHGAMWRAFLERLQDCAGSEEKEAAIVLGATRTFLDFEIWMNGWLDRPTDDSTAEAAAHDRSDAIMALSGIGIASREPRNGCGAMRIGTRGSPLAVAQTREVRRLLAAAHGCAETAFEIVVIRTSGDTIQDRALAEGGGKGLFTKEIDAAMIKGEIDAAVHSSKDLPTVLSDGVAIAGYLPREDVRDALISGKAGSIATLPFGATLGTASLRRQAQIKRLRPDIRIELLRGNVETRLRKAETGEVDATLLAYAGLKRLGLAHRATALLEIDDFLPAVGQGAIGVTARTEDRAAHKQLAPVLDVTTARALAAERAFLEILDGSCRTPIAGYACAVSGRLDFRGMVLRADGSEVFEAAASGALADAEKIGAEAGRDLLERLPAGVLP